MSSLSTLNAADRLHVKSIGLDEARAAVGDPRRDAMVRGFYRLVHREGARGFADLRGKIAADRIDFLRDRFEIEGLEIADVRHSALDGTRKYLLRLRDGSTVESVLIPNRDHATLCVSSQAGCALACRFCATGRLGFRRDLETWEIVDQLLIARRESGHPITDIVFMGMGEPLLNYDRVMKTAELFNAADGASVSYKKISISTAGVVPAIRRYAREGRKYRLVFSLSSADPEKRRKLMPITEQWPLDEFVDSIREYAESQGGKKWMVLEYVAIRNVNMGDEDVDAIGDNVRGFKYLIDVIPYNSIGNELASPSWDEVKAFTTRLRRLRVPVKVRYSGGKDMDSGCGQLGAEEWNRRRGGEAGPDVIGIDPARP